MDGKLTADKYEGYFNDNINWFTHRQPVNTEH